MSTLTSFNFSIEQKQTCWVKSYYDIEADSYEAAEKIAMEIYNNGIGSMDNEAIVSESEIDPDNFEDMCPEENDGQTTRSLTYEIDDINKVIVKDGK